VWKRPRRGCGCRRCNRRCLNDAAPGGGRSPGRGTLSAVAHGIRRRPPEAPRVRRVGEPGSRLPCWCACRERCLSRLWCRGSRRRRATGAVSPVSRARGGSEGHPEGAGANAGPDTIRPSVVSYRLYSLLIVACRRRARFARSPHDSLAMQVKNLLLCWSRAASALALRGLARALRAQPGVMYTVARAGSRSPSLTRTIHIRIASSRQKVPHLGGTPLRRGAELRVFVRSGEEQAAHLLRHLVRQLRRQPDRCRRWRPAPRSL
jgi:hypothetical protein